MHKTYIKNVHGIKLIYTMSETGWTYRVSGFPNKATRRKALALYPKHRPEYPPHLVDSIVQANMEFLEAIAALRSLQ